MRPRLLIDSAEVPGGGELRLYQRDTEFSIMLGGTELMNSRVSGSEEALARLTCAPLATVARPVVLIGGLGMGFTLRAALALLPGDARVIVVELVPEVIDWARGVMAEMYGACLDDPRVELVAGDVADLIRHSGGGYDAILLDVDNGPDGLTREENDRLYDARGLGSAKAALRPGGVLAIWSSASDKGFSNRLRRAGFTVDEQVVRTRGDKGGRHLIWLAKR